MNDATGIARLRRACERNGATLTARELEVAYALAIDLETNASASEVLFISVSTLEVHAEHITRRVKASGRGVWRIILARWYGQQEVIDLAAEGGLVPVDRFGRCSGCGRERDAVWDAEDGTPDAFARHDCSTPEHAAIGCHAYRMTLAAPAGAAVGA